MSFRSTQDAQNIFFAKQTQQVIENKGEVSEIGQNNPNFGHLF